MSMKAEFLLKIFEMNKPIHSSSLKLNLDRSNNKRKQLWAQKGSFSAIDPEDLIEKKMFATAFQLLVQHIFSVPTTSAKKACGHHDKSIFEIFLTPPH